MIMENKKKVIIIGGGVSGLTAGIYALDNGYDVTILEKHSLPGGECTGWTRKGIFIDGCAHWIVGTNPSSVLNPIWQHIGAFDNSTKIYETEFFTKMDINGEIVTFYSDLNKLKEELLRVAPEDKRQINHFIKTIKAYQHVQIPVDMPLDYMTQIQYALFGLKMLPMVIPYIKYRKISCEEYALKFHSPILKEAFKRILSPGYNMHSYFYIMQALSRNDAGMVEGGSLAMAQRIKNTFLIKGGKILLNTPVDKILIKNNTAYGVKVNNEEEMYADYIISSVDAHYLLHHLLRNKYHDNFLEEKFVHKEDNPLQESVQLSYKINKDIRTLPKMINIPCDNVMVGPLKIDALYIRNHSFDQSLYKDTSLISVLIAVNEDVYDYFKNLTKEEYKKAKDDLGEIVRGYIKDYYHFQDEEIECIDVTTPLTYERYANAYKGSYMAFITTKKTKGLMKPGIIKGVNNLIMAGQWIMPPGGLPIAIFSGKHAAIRLTKLDHQNFIDLDKEFKLRSKAKLKVTD